MINALTRPDTFGRLRHRIGLLVKHLKLGPKQVVHQSRLPTALTPDNGYRLILEVLWLLHVLDDLRKLFTVL